MPLDNSFDYDFIRHCLGWRLEFSLLPRRCHYTKKSVWLKRAYRGTAMWNGPGTPVFEDRWIDKKSYIFLKLKGTI